MASAGQIPSNYSSKSAQRSDRDLSELARQQHGVVSLTQLLALGWSESTVRSRVKAGRLHRLHTGVYAVGHRVVGGDGWWMAAVLACGDGAVLSHRSAAALWGIRPTARSRIDVISPGRAGRSRVGIEVHRPGGLTSSDVTRRRGIPATTVARTLLDLAAVVDRQALEKAINEAEVLRLFDLKVTNASLERAPRHRGAAALRETFAHLDPLQARTRSELEGRFLALCRTAGLPPPEVNAWIELDGQQVEVEFLWRRQRVAVETDSYAFHSTRRAFRRDRRRLQLFARAGWLAIPLSWDDVVKKPEEVVRTLRELLSGEGGIRTHEAAFTAHAISSRAP